MKLMNRAKNIPKLEPPADETITSLYIGGIDDSIQQSDLNDAFYSFGELRNIYIVQRQRCAFVEFTTREAAEHAANTLFNKLVINGLQLRLMWATKSQTTGASINDNTLPNSFQQPSFVMDSMSNPMNHQLPLVPLPPLPPLPPLAHPLNIVLQQDSSQVVEGHEPQYKKQKLSIEQNQDNQEGPLNENIQQILRPRPPQGPPPSHQKAMYYPSMNPNRLGSAPEEI